MPPKRKAVFLEENESKKEIKKVSLKLSKKESKKISKKVVEEVDSDDDDEEDDDDDEEEEQPKTKKQKTNAKEGNAKVQTIKKTNLKDKILHLLAKQEKLIGPATIKKILKEEYDVADNKANNTRIAKTLKDLSEEERDDFGKIGGSYHGGETSAAYEDYVKKCEFEKMCKDHLQCPHCDTWNHEDESYIDEDSVARGGVHKCKSCKKRFYTWISDYDRRGHIVEYRYGDGKDDYARRRQQLQV